MDVVASHSMCQQRRRSATNIIMFLIARLLCGFGECIFVCHTTPNFTSSHDKMKKHLSLFYTCIPLGSSIGMITIGVWESTQLIDWHLIYMTQFMINAFIICLYSSKMKNIDQPNNITVDLTNNILTPKQKFIAIMNQPYIITSILGNSFHSFVLGAFSSWSVLWITKTHHLINVSTTSIATGVITVVTGIFGSMTGGLALNKMKLDDDDTHWKCNATIANKMIIAFSLAVIASSVSSNFTSNTTLFFILHTLTYASMYLCTVPYNSFLIWTAKRVGTLPMAMSIFLAHALGDAISPVIIGKMLDVTNGNYKAVFILVTIWSSGATILWITTYWLS